MEELFMHSCTRLKYRLNAPIYLFTVYSMLFLYTTHFILSFKHITILLCCRRQISCEVQTPN